MVLVDTSVWIRFLANRPPYAAELNALLGDDDVAGHEFVFGELLLGDRSGRRLLLSAYAEMPYAAVVPNHEVVQFVRARNLQGRGVGWVDVHVLASAIVERIQLWTADERLSAVATEFGVAYQASHS